MKAPYENLEAWKAAHELTLEIYKVTLVFPDHERFGIVSQIRRAAFSVPVNIVEGKSRQGKKEWRKFLGYSLGSLAEVDYFLRLSNDLDYISDGMYKDLCEKRDKAGRLLWGLFNSLK